MHLSKIYLFESHNQEIDGHPLSVSLSLSQDKLTSVFTEQKQYMYIIHLS